MTDIELPEDVISALTHLSNGDGANEATQLSRDLLAKYAQKPATLDERFDITWERTITDNFGDTCTESDHVDGLKVTAKNFAYRLDGNEGSVGSLMEWPEIDGIDPRELLNDGWLVQKRLLVPDGYDIAYSVSTTDSGHKRVGTFQPDWHAPDALIVFCRPPEGDSQ